MRIKSLEDFKRLKKGQKFYSVSLVMSLFKIDEYLFREIIVANQIHAFDYKYNYLTTIHFYQDERPSTSIYVTTKKEIPLALAQIYSQALKELNKSLLQTLKKINVT